MAEVRYPTTAILGLFTGEVATPWEGKAPSAISKSKRFGPLKVTPLGLEGDHQADLEVHGGVDQALHHYSAEHMPFWKSEFPDHDARFGPGCFGENISTPDFTDDSICIGDVVELGTAVVQVTQGRKPCWKLDAHIGRPGMAYSFRKTLKTGWYYRVLETGTVKEGDAARVVERTSQDWSVSRVTKALFDAKLDKVLADQLAALPHLSKVWRDHFSKIGEA